MTDTTAPNATDATTAVAAPSVAATASGAPVMATAPVTATAAAAASEPVRRLPARLDVLLRRPSSRVVQLACLSTLIANTLIVITGGAVRLTDSGLGCPTWPSCTDSSLTPTKQYAIHGIIEFSNRQLTFVLAVVAVATWLVAMALRRERALATVAALGIPAQAVLGGLTVLTHLNPWLVALHFLLSMAIIAVTFALWWRLRGVEPDVAPPAAAVWLTRVTVAVT